MVPSFATTGFAQRSLCHVNTESEDLKTLYLDYTQSLRLRTQSTIPSSITTNFLQRTIYTLLSDTIEYVNKKVFHNACQNRDVNDQMVDRIVAEIKEKHNNSVEDDYEKLKIDSPVTLGAMLRTIPSKGGKAGVGASEQHSAVLIYLLARLCSDKENRPSILNDYGIRVLALRYISSLAITELGLRPFSFVTFKFDTDYRKHLFFIDPYHSYSYLSPLLFDLANSKEAEDLVYQYNKVLGYHFGVCDFMRHGIDTVEFNLKDKHPPFNKIPRHPLNLVVLKDEIKNEVTNQNLICLINGRLMSDPVHVVYQNGEHSEHAYERVAIQAFFREKRYKPVEDPKTGRLISKEGHKVVPASDIMGKTWHFVLTHIQNNPQVSETTQAYYTTDDGDKMLEPSSLIQMYYEKKVEGVERLKAEKKLQELETLLLDKNSMEDNVHVIFLRKIAASAKYFLSNAKDLPMNGGKIMAFITSVLESAVVVATQKENSTENLRYLNMHKHHPFINNGSDYIEKTLNKSNAEDDIEKSETNKKEKRNYTENLTNMTHTLTEKHPDLADLKKQLKLLLQQLSSVGKLEDKTIIKHFIKPIYRLLKHLLKYQELVQEGHTLKEGFSENSQELLMNLKKTYNDLSDRLGLFQTKSSNPKGIESAKLANIQNNIEEINKSALKHIKKTKENCDGLVKKLRSANTKKAYEFKKKYEGLEQKRFDDRKNVSFQSAFFIGNRKHFQKVNATRSEFKEEQEKREDVSQQMLSQAEQDDENLLEEHGELDPLEFKSNF